MTELEQQILDIIQDGFPIVERPYAAIAEQLGGVTEQQVFEAVENLRTSGVIRRIGGVYDTKRLGLVSRLCAGRVPESDLDFDGATDRPQTELEKFAAAVMDVPAITHNYVRSHEYNVWFTVIAENESALQSVIDKLIRETALHDVHSMPAKKMFKINTVMGKAADTKQEAGRTMEHRENMERRDNSGKSAEIAPSLTEMDKARIRLLSGNLPHSLTPFTDLFQGVILSGAKNLETILGEARADLSSKRMRRFGAVLRHQQAGFPCNAMVCFDVGASGKFIMDASAAGAVLAANPHVSHCYERPPFDGFPYNVYAMFHAQTPEELSQFVGEVATALENPEFAVLHSVRELKKTSYKYFA
ncbi:MAG: Lrp/AsnC family transcriptional regulator [Fibrobacter sp.]|nr:Lrp/AsnC family transcriptional regulator [Fibrobacter sp.]